MSLELQVCGCMKSLQLLQGEYALCYYNKIIIKSGLQEIVLVEEV